MINIGANDYDVLAERFADDLAGGITLEFLAELIPATLATITGVTQAIVDQAAAFAAAGIETVIVVDLFADYTPQVQNDPLVAPLGEIIIGLNNAALAAAVTRLDRDPTVDVDIELVRLSALFDEIFDDPSSFNILSLSEPVYLSLPFGDPAQPGAFDILRNPDLPATVGLDQLLFWDVLHLSASGQDIASAYLGAALQDDLRFLGEGDDSFVDRVAGDLSGAPDDVVFAGRGFDTVNGGLGDDVLFGGADGDWLDGGVGDDIVVGGSGDDRLSGGMRQPGSLALGGGFDVLSGGDGNDSLAGGDGADFLSDGLGADHVAGDAGRDVLVFVHAPLLGGRREAPGGDRFDGGDGFDTLLLFIEDTALRNEAVSGVRAAVDTGGLAAFSLDSLGLTVVDVERVIVFGERRLPRDLDLPARLAEAVAEADAWNGIPLSADGPFTIASDAVYDSGLGAIL